MSVSISIDMNISDAISAGWTVASEVAWVVETILYYISHSCIVMCIVTTSAMHARRRSGVMPMCVKYIYHQVELDDDERRRRRRRIKRRNRGMAFHVPFSYFPSIHLSLGHLLLYTHLINQPLGTVPVFPPVSSLSEYK